MVENTFEINNWIKHGSSSVNTQNSDLVNLKLTRSLLFQSYWVSFSILFIWVIHLSIACIWRGSWWTISLSSWKIHNAERKTSPEKSIRILLKDSLARTSFCDTEKRTNVYFQYFEEFVPHLLCNTVTTNKSRFDATRKISLIKRMAKKSKIQWLKFSSLQWA